MRTGVEIYDQPVIMVIEISKEDMKRQEATAGSKSGGKNFQSQQDDEEFYLVSQLIVVVDSCSSIVLFLTISAYESLGFEAIIHTKRRVLGMRFMLELTIAGSWWLILSRVSCFDIMRIRMRTSTGG